MALPAENSDQTRHALASFATGVFADIIEENGCEATIPERSYELSRLHAELVRSETSLAEAQSIARIGSWEVDLVTNHVSWSRELYRLFDFGLDEEPSHEALIERTHPEDQASAIEAIVTAMDDFTPFVIEHRLLLADGTIRWIRARGRLEVDAAGRPERLHGTAQDITDQRTAEEALVHQAFHDPLSGLPNRLLFRDRLSQALKRLSREPSTVGVIYVDIDRFKVINDSLGHPVGDQLLLATATRLAALVRPGDTLARIGGDEFVVLCEGLSGEAEAIFVADRFCAAMIEPLAWDGGELVISVSAGVAVATSTLVSPDSLLRDADVAMHRAKSEGRARSAMFAQSMRRKAIGRLDTEVSLRRAIRDGELRIHYQPIVNLSDGETVGHEALVRWDHPTRGLLEPDQFIPIAEETGLIVPLGTWVLREACRQAKQFQDRDPRWSRLTMAVNMSGGQLGQPDLCELVASSLSDAGLAPQHLQLEMTESILMDDAATTVKILQTLKGLDVRLAIDDFGTGYSSLAYLKRFPVDVLKIDRSFVRGLGKNPEDSAIVATVMSLADTLGLSSIAEGVETDLERDCLVASAAPTPGYFFARPVDASAAEAALDGLANTHHPERMCCVDGPNGTVCTRSSITGWETPAPEAAPDARVMFADVCGIVDAQTGGCDGRTENEKPKLGRHRTGGRSVPGRCGVLQRQDDERDNARQPRQPRRRRKPPRPRRRRLRWCLVVTATTSTRTKVSHRSVISG